MLSRFAVLSSRSYCRARSSVDVKEMEHFTKLGLDWWDLEGPVKLLHLMNKVRIPVVRDQLLESKGLKIGEGQGLAGFSILDVGCGAGILTEALARIQGNIVGLDSNADLIENALEHSRKQGLDKLEYVCTTIEDYSEKCPERFDAVIMSEIIEHVDEKEQFLNAAVKCVKPGGSVFMTTMPKNWMAGFVNIFLFENVLGYIPKGTHHLDKFISRGDLEKILEKENCETVFRRGMFYNPVTSQWNLSKNFELLWYIIQAVKTQK